VRKPWERLAGYSLVSTIGITWLSIRYGLPEGGWAWIEIAGMVLSSALALGAAVRSYAKKWPAVVALVCAAPAAQNLLVDFPMTMELAIRLGMAYVLFLAGAIATVVGSVVILVMRPPPPPSDEVIARARLVR